MSQFTQIISALNSAGLSNARLAHLCDCSPGTIANWSNGKSEPGYSQGKLLIDLHAENCMGHQAISKEAG